LSPALTVTDAVLRGMLLAWLALLSAGLRWRCPHTPAARVGAALAAGLAVQVVEAAAWQHALLPAAWLAPLTGVSIANAVLFWLFARALFDDGFVTRPVHAATWLLVGLAGWLSCLAGPSAAWAVVTQRGLPLVFGGLVLAVAVRHWRDDLWEPRRRLRALVAGGGVAYVLATAAWAWLAPTALVRGLGGLPDLLLLWLVVGAVAWGLLVPQPQALLAGLAVPPSPEDRPADTGPGEAAGSPPADSADEPDAADQALAARVQALMRDEHAYRDEGLSVGTLADRLRVPEYRLRRAIIRVLGHRNFSAFVHGYRLAEARAALSDPARAGEPVLSIALETGFQSIGPFNRAFKADTGLTPTEFRRQQQAA